jgi:DNA repair exonuclease SbcCD ATPase subunit
VRAERAEAVTAKDVFQADEALNHRLHQLSLELENMKTATRAAMRRAEESVEETKKMAEELEQAHAHTRQVENEMATATRQIKQLEERERLIRQETETLRKLNREREEEIGKMAEMLNQADIRVQGAETSANVAAKRAKVTETRDEARDAGMRADEMEVDGNDLNRIDGPEVGQNADNSSSSKIEISTRKGKGVAQMQDSDDERDVSSTLRQVQYAISSDEETDSVKTLRDRPNSASGPSAMDIDRPTRSATNQMSVVCFILFHAYSTKPRINIAPTPKLQKTERRYPPGIGSSHVG